MPVDPLSSTNEQLYKVYTNLSELSGVQVNALTKQTNIMDMVKSENQRLIIKKIRLIKRSRIKKGLFISTTIAEKYLPLGCESS